MKKLIGAACLSAVIAIGITAYANDSLTISSVSTDNAVISYNGTESHTLYAAVYRDGILIGVEKTDAETITVDAQNGEVKVFCWDDSMRPLTEPVAFNMKPVKVNNITGYDTVDKSVTIGESKVTISEDFSGYINRTPIDDDLTAGELVTELYEDKLSMGENILLIDLLTDNDPDSYDMIAINQYGTAVVDEIVEKSDGISRLNFAIYTAGMRAMLDLDTENASYTAALDGDEIDINDIQAGDVLSIKYNPYEAFRDSEYYDIIVSRDTVSGFCTAVSEDETQYTFGGEAYEAAATYPDIDVKEPYTVYLDVFGRIAYAELNIYERNIGILTNIYEKEDNSFYASVITRTGVTEEFLIAENNADIYALEYLKAGAWDENGVTYDPDMGLSKLNLYPSQVVQYYIDPDTDELEILRDCSGNKWIADKDEYKASAGRFGTIRVGESSTILDISGINEDDSVIAITREQLVDGGRYSGYGYEMTANAKHAFILITETSYIPDNPVTPPGGDDYPYASDALRMAIFKSSQKVVENGAERTQWTVLSYGDEYYYIVNETIASTTGVAYGDPLIIDTDADGEIISAVHVLQASNLLGTTFIDFSSTVIDTGFSGILSQPSGTYWNNMFPSDGNWNQDMLFGVIVNRDGNRITLCTSLEDGKYINLDRGTELYGVNTCGNIYSYVFGTREPVRFDDGVQSTYKPRGAMTTKPNGDELLDITNEDVKNDVVYAAVRVEDDEIIELYQIYYEYE